MLVGVPKEIKDGEQRVALTPLGAEVLARAGHTVLIESGAGAGSRLADEQYAAAGARIVAGAADAWSAELVLKVKEPQPSEFGYFRRGQILFTYLHLAVEPELAHALLDGGVTGVAYETVRSPNGALPLLTPMSEIAGRLAPQVAATELTYLHGGCGKLLGGVPGVPPAQVVILGAGTVGTHAAQIALGMGAAVTVFDINLERLRWIDTAVAGRLTTVAASAPAIAQAVHTADAVIGAVLVPGARTPVLVTEAMVREMPPGAVIVDVAVDQGGCVETIHRTTHSDPTYLLHGVLHYGVANQPGSVPNTATVALCNATLPYALQLANAGPVCAAAASPALAAGVNTYEGAITHPAVAQALGLDWVSFPGQMVPQQVPS